jgi:GH15 family glucan-1,4-alpha-glucosidase
MPDYKISSRYIEDTAIVEFKLSNDKNQLVVRDFMVPHPVKDEVSQCLVRSITGKQGKAVFRFQPRSEFGLHQPEIKAKKNQLKFALEQGSVVLHLPDGSEVIKESDHYQISIYVKSSQSNHLILEYVPKGKKASAKAEDLERITKRFWLDWVEKGKFINFCRDNLVRSAITLKLMQFYPTGALVAAPTTSLPEEIGGVRNWDYRFVWIRDATFALYSFYVLGYEEEARHFFDFIEKVTENCADNNLNVSLMYTIHGEPVPKEQDLGHLSGYKSSSPVRIGNNASRQFQLDVYGALIDAFYFVSKRSLSDLNVQKWRTLVLQLVRKIEEQWQEADHGIWEARVGIRHYTYSKAMAWVGVDRVMRLEKTLDLKASDMKNWSKLAGAIKSYVWENCYKDGNLVQHPKTNAADATNFLFVLLQFLDKHEPNTKVIIDKTSNELTHSQIFVHRYIKPDGLPGEEGAFVLCSFWLISALAILEDIKTAIRLFKQMEKYIKPHGLLSEEIDPRSGQYLGNYPQAFSHMGYIMSAHYIHKYAKRHDLELPQSE